MKPDGYKGLGGGALKCSATASIVLLGSIGNPVAGEDSPGTISTEPSECTGDPDQGLSGDVCGWVSVGTATDRTGRCGGRASVL